jgi:Zn-dependent peptidase ImmA (M78 family)
LETEELHVLADAIGVTISHHVGGEKGWYEHRHRGISLRADLGPTRYKCTLAHELAHALAGDEPTGIAWADERMERAADITAARWLISPDAYAAAESLCGSHRGALARELGVTLHVLDTWRGLYERTRAA